MKSVSDLLSFSDDDAVKMWSAQVSGKDFTLHPPAVPDVYIKETREIHK